MSKSVLNMLKQTSGGAAPAPALQPTSVSAPSTVPTPVPIVASTTLAVAPPPDSTPPSMTPAQVRAALKEKEASIAAAAATAPSGPAPKANATTASKIGANVTAAPKCCICAKTVYKPEEVNALGRLWHNSCFTCGSKQNDGCGKTLKIAQGYSEHSNTPYCNNCYGKLFGPKGFSLSSGINTTYGHEAEKETQHAREVLGKGEFASLNIGTASTTTPASVPTSAPVPGPARRASGSLGLAAQLQSMSSSAAATPSTSTASATPSTSTTVTAKVSSLGGVKAVKDWLLECLGDVEDERITAAANAFTSQGLKTTVDIAETLKMGLLSDTAVQNICSSGGLGIGHIGKVVSAIKAIGGNGANSTPIPPTVPIPVAVSAPIAPAPAPVPAPAPAPLPIPTPTLAPAPTPLAALPPQAPELVQPNMPSRGSIISAVTQETDRKTSAVRAKGVEVGTNASRPVHKEQTFIGDGDEVDDSEW